MVEGPPPEATNPGLPSGRENPRMGAKSRRSAPVTGRTSGRARAKQGGTAKQQLRPCMGAGCIYFELLVKEDPLMKVRNLIS